MWYAVFLFYMLNVCVSIFVVIYSLYNKSGLLIMQEPCVMKFTEDQIVQLLSSFWIQATLPDNLPSNFEAIAHSFNLTLISLRLKVKFSTHAFSLFLSFLVFSTHAFSMKKTVNRFLDLSWYRTQMTNSLPASSSFRCFSGICPWILTMV